MFKDKMRLVGDFILKNNKIVFPLVGILAVAITVSAALGAVSSRKAEDIMPESSAGVETEVDVSANVPLVENEDAAIKELIMNYYNAQAIGDLETLKTLCDEISELDMLSFEEKANYIEYYPAIEIYTKKGMNEGETIVYVYYRMTFVNHEEEFPGYTSHYVCTAEDGSLYIKRGNFSEELNNYTSMVCAQDDVVEFNNRVIAEYDAFKESYPELASYPEEVMTQVNMTVGVRWSEMQSAAEGDVSGGDVSGGDVSGGDVSGGNVPTGPMYAIATTTVNVRSSDSQQADKLGKVTEGARLEVLEVRPNGWTKLVYEGKEGYIKSEFLQMEEVVQQPSAEGVEVTGTVTATTNVNVRAEASETAEKLGKLLGGESVELIGREGDWCKIKFGGVIGYVKAEFVQ
ncbi:MAG: hypothetical protein E7292_02555 [Lachnospiraceae bacterium]|nr:hypothetical protein [Lachnospiraceae bacterium]